MERSSRVVAVLIMGLQLVASQTANCNTQDYFGIISHLGDFQTYATECKTQSTNAGTSSSYLELVKCNSACYNLADTGLAAFADLNCDIQISDLSKAAPFVDGKLPDGFKLEDLISKAKAAGMTEIENSQFKTAKSDLEQLCQNIDGSTQNCQQQLTALQNKSNPQHSAVCSSGVDQECVALVNKIVAFGKTVPIFEPYLIGFDMSDLESNCESATTATTTSSSTRTSTSSPPIDTTVESTIVGTKIQTTTQEGTVKVYTVSPTRSPTPRPTPQPTARTTNTANTRYTTTATGVPRTLSPTPPPFIPPTQPQHPACTQLQLTIGFFGNANLLACGNQLKAAGNNPDYDVLMQCDSVCFKAADEALSSIAKLQCDVQLDMIGSILNNSDVTQQIKAAKDKGITEIATGQISLMSQILTGGCDKLPSESPAATCVDEFSALSNKSNPIHNQVCEKIDDKCIQLGSLLQELYASQGQTFNADSLSVNCSSNSHIPWERLSTSAPPNPNCLDCDPSNNNGGDDDDNDDKVHNSAISVVVPAVVGGVFGLMAIAGIFILINRRRKHASAGISYTQLNSMVDMNEMDDLEGNNDSIVSGGLVLNNSDDGKYEDALAPQVFGMRS